MTIQDRVRRNPIAAVLGWLFLGLPGLLFATRKRWPRN